MPFESARLLRLGKSGKVRVLSNTRWYEQHDSRERPAILTRAKAQVIKQISPSGSRLTGQKMNIMLGNQSVSQIEQRLGIEFPEEIREFMKQTHEPNASKITKGKWHCFDLPFNLVCGDIETAMKIFNSIKDRSSECKEGLQFSLSN